MSKFNYLECVSDHFREESCVAKPLTIDENPTIVDKVLFRFKTTKSGDNCDFCCDDTADDYCQDDCLDPFTFDDITIYYIERNFSNRNTYSNEDTTFHYSDAVVVYKIGSPLWTNNILECPTEEEIARYKRSSNSNPKLSKVLSCPNPNDELGYKRNSKDEQDPDNLLIKKIDGKVGCFEFVWTPDGVREGDYFICWTYTPYKGSSRISNHQKFYLGSSTALNTSTLIHQTNPQKYFDLLERYTPEMFKEYISESDKTPFVLEKLNRSIAKGFNVLEDLTNQIVDLLDSNAVNEYIIYFLSNTLNLNLKGNDPILWRRQIKEAVPLFKKKGTKSSLKEAFDQAGMRLLRILSYWQVINPYYYVDSFIFNSTNTFELTKKILGDKIKVSVHTPDSFKNLSSEDYDIIQEEFTTKLYLKVSPELDSIINIEYFYAIPKNDFENDIFEYIQNLPLMDNRNSFLNNKPILPLKNWNTKLIEENDPFIDHIIKTRHPFTDDVIFGKIRTEFPYSENIYNMEEYNASIRDSKNPCDIDKDFLDTCTGCRSSSFDVDLEIQNLCDDRILEAKEIISENTPFHSMLRTVNYFGGNNEYFITPLENYEILINYKHSENNLSGGLQRWFHRNRLFEDLYKRNEVSSKTLDFISDASFYNEKIRLLSPEFDFDSINLPNCYIEILVPSVYNGIHTLSNFDKNFADITVENYINNSTFVFNLYSEVSTYSSIELIRDDIVELKELDGSIDFTKLELKNSYKVVIDSNSYDIKEIYPNKLILNNNGNKINKNFSTKYKILDDSQKEVNIKSGVNSLADITYTNRTRVNSSLPTEQKKYYDRNLVFIKNSIKYSCQVTGLGDGEFFIKGYFGEDTGGIYAKLINYIAKGQIGSLSYSGIKCIIEDLPAYFIDNYSEYAIKITSQNFLNNYYFIAGVEQTSEGYVLNLFGDFENFGLVSNKKLNSCEFYKYKSNTMTINEQNRNLDEIDMEINRNNLGIIQKEIEIKCEGKTSSTNYNEIQSTENNGPTENSIQKENISVIIQGINGEQKEVNL